MDVSIGGEGGETRCPKTTSLARVAFQDHYDSVGFEGYFLTSLKWIERITFAFLPSNYALLCAALLYQRELNRIFPFENPLRLPRTR
jgi:hypothetical protein